MVGTDLGYVQLGVVGHFKEAPSAIEDTVKAEVGQCGSKVFHAVLEFEPRQCEVGGNGVAWVRSQRIPMRRQPSHDLLGTLDATCDRIAIVQKQVHISLPNTGTVKGCLQSKSYSGGNIQFQFAAKTT